MSAANLNQLALKVILDWNGSMNLHFVNVD
jgi:hypothetical protein